MATLLHVPTSSSDDRPHWVPLSSRGDSADEEAYLETCYRGVPDHLRPPLWDLLREFLGTGYHSGISTHKAQSIGVVLRRGIEDEDGLQRACEADEAFFLDVLDYALASASATRAKRTETLLVQAGSAWTVASRPKPETGFMLVERIDVTVQRSIEQAIRIQGAGSHLAVAYGAIYGRVPNPDHGYAHTVMAVEIAMKPVVSPSAVETTLGKMIGVLRDKPVKWATELSEGSTDPAHTPVEIVRELSQVIWRNHYRHGDEEKPVHHTIGEAEAAFHAAILLVHWFESGAMRLRQ